MLAARIEDENVQKLMKCALGLAMQVHAVVLMSSLALFLPPVGVHLSVR
jgi:hypothetical protein